MNDKILTFKKNERISVVWYLRGFFFMLLLAVLLLTYQPLMQWWGKVGFLDKMSTVVQINDVNYAGAPGQAMPWQKVVSLTQGEQQAQINFDFKADQLVGYSDVFQTDNVNQGIRVEVAHDPTVSQPESHLEQSPAMGNMMAIIIGGAEAPLTALLTNKLSLYEWHHIRIQAWQHHFVQVWLDGLPLPTITSNQIDYKVSDIKVGGGFDGTRPFYGQLANFSLHNKVIDAKHRNKVKRISVLLAAISALLAFFCFFKISPIVFSRRTKIEYLSFWIGLGFFTAVAFHYINAFYGSKVYPENTFLCYGLGQQFKDFYDTLLIDQFLDPYYSSVYRGEYFPFSYVFFYPLTWLDKNLSLTIYYLTFFIGYIYFLKRYCWLKNGKSIDNQGVARVYAGSHIWYNLLHLGILGFLTYPLLFAFERGNIEIFLFLLLIGFISCYQRGYLRTSYLFLSVATAFKLYPIVFCVLLWSDRRYKETFIVISLVLLLELLSMLLFQHSLKENWQTFKLIMHGMSNHCTLEKDKCVQYSVSLWGLIKTAYAFFAPEKILTLKKLHFYFYSTVLFSALIAGYVIFIEKLFWKKVALLTFCMLLFPVVSYDYKLLHLYLPLFLFLQCKPARYDLLYATFFVLMFIPKNYASISEGHIGLESVSGPLLCTLMAIVIISQGVWVFWQSRKEM